MKHLKTKLMASVAMLMVATVMISSASFAWFTISTQPEVSGVEAGLATNQALEIALVGTGGFDTPAQESTSTDTGKNVTWGNLVDVSAYFNNEANKATLRPVLYDDSAKTLGAPLFGADGRTNGSTILTEEYKAISTTPAVAYNDGAIKVYKTGTGESEVIYAYQIDYFMRTNVQGAAIKLLEPTAADKDRGAGVAGAGTTITEGSKCTVQFKVDNGAWVTYYNGAAASGTPAFNFTDPIIASATANTVYKVSMRVFWDGSAATNANLALTGQECAVNAQFTTVTPLVGLGAKGDATVSPKPAAAN